MNTGEHQTGMAVIVIAFGAGAIAKLASAFVLLTLALVNAAVIILRFARIASYAPGFRSPFFPYLQIFGIGVAIYLIIKLGPLPLILIAAVIGLTLIWFYYFGRDKSAHSAGAIHTLPTRSILIIVFVGLWSM